MDKQLNLFSIQDKEQSAVSDGIESLGLPPKASLAHEASGRNEQDMLNSQSSILNSQSSILYSSLEEAKSAAMSCKKCVLCKERTKVVFSDGLENAKIMIIGEGPGENEDLQGLPFVGRAGQLLDKIFTSVNLNRKEHLYICNVVKCRPPNNRAPADDEAEACRDYLEAQIKYIDPKIIILAGAVAVKKVLKLKDPKITKLRGQWIDGMGDLLQGRKIMPIFHPSYLLRHEWNKNPDSPKALMWQDIQEIRKSYDALK